jgi:hypothetical protein
VANEISLTIGGSGVGLTGVYVRTLTGVTLGSPIALTEVAGAGGVYVGSMVGAAGEYVLLSYDSANNLIGSSGSYTWDGTAFVEEASGGTGGGLGPEDIERLERIEQQLIADTIKGATRFKRLLAGTDTVILDKDVTYDPITGFTLTEHESS